MWDDLLERHGQMNYHLQVGGGDQVRCRVWCPSVVLSARPSQGATRTPNTHAKHTRQTHTPNTHTKHTHAPQIYCDDVWSLPAVLQWVAIDDPHARAKVPFSAAMLQEAEQYYFGHYCR
jgi:hypothetical protein